MKILVTGGAGFIGSHIVDAYIKERHEVTVVDDLSSGIREFVHQKAKFYKIDIRNESQIADLIRKEKPDIINHHAAQISVRNSVDNPVHDAGINIVGLLHILEAGRRGGVKKFIFASSGGAIYGDARILPTPETYQPLQPLSPYGISKLASEYYLQYYFHTYQIPFVALRYSNVYGPRQNPHGEAGVVSIFSLHLIRNESPIIHGDGMQTRDYVYVGDVVEANKLAITSSYGGSFNIGTGVETSVVDLYRNLKKIFEIDSEAVHGPPKRGEQKRSCLSTKLAQKKLGWKAKTDLHKGLVATVSYFREYAKEKKD